MTLDMPSIPLTVLVLVGVGSPALLTVLLGVTSLLDRPLPERWTGPLAGSSMMIACAALLTGFVVHGLTGTGTQLLSYGAWSTSHRGGIAIEFLADRPSLAFAALSTAIAGIVSAFSNRYLHREGGYNRYFVLLAIFVTGMLLVALAGNVAVLFIGWEFVGLSSALLVAFFQERPAAVANAFRVLSVYRISDAAMLAAAVLLRHVAGTDSLSLLFGGAAPTARLSATHATIIAILIIVAVAGKSALLPFSSWLPRAMEGPTPSSAVYYGSLSIHAGCFLLLRAGPLLEQAPAARFLAACLGVATALFAGTTTRVQSDVKSSLAYASLTQVGIIVTEIAVGWYTLAFIHLAGHACFRLLQFLSAPNVVHDLHGLEDAIGNHGSPAGGHPIVVRSHRARRQLFLIALERGFLDSILDRVVVEPFAWLAGLLTRLDQWLCDAVLPARLPAAVDEGDQDE
jgi:NADH-quinone oxidoreductase subunit L